jgi:hypothetical protein
MRQSLFILVLFISGHSYSQRIEATVSAYGFGNYTPGAGSNNVRFTDLSYSPMASVMYRKFWTNALNDKIAIESGIGLTYTKYSGSWQEYVADGLVGGNITSSDELYNYNATMNALGIEITPLILTFWNRLELRSGLFAGVPIGNQYTQEYGKSYTITTPSGVLIADGALEEVPVTFAPNSVLHWNSRVSINFNLKHFSIAPFYQLSQGLSKEGTSPSVSDIKTYRRHFGLTFGYQFDK